MNCPGGVFATDGNPLRHIGPDCDLPSSSTPTLGAFSSSRPSRSSSSPSISASTSTSSGVTDLARFLTGNRSGRGLSDPLARFHNAQALHNVPRHCGVSTSPQFVHCRSSSSFRGGKRPGAAGAVFPVLPVLPFLDGLAGRDELAGRVPAEAFGVRVMATSCGDTSRRGGEAGGEASGEGARAGLISSLSSMLGQAIDQM
jgi:hypothetical protein